VNEQQAYLAIRNAIRLEDLGVRTAAEITPELTRIFRWLGDQIRALPGGEIEREMEYRGMRQQIASIFRPVNAQFYVELRQALGEESYRQVRFAQDYLRIAEAGESNRASSNPSIKEALSTPVIDSGGALGGASATPVQISRTQLQALTRETKVLGQRLETLFGIDTDESLWIKDNIKLIDQTVKRGFLLGQTNEQISRDLAIAGKTSRSRAHAISRTAVMDMSANAQEEFWQANNGAIAGWEFDASMDNRVCPLCAPWDGRTAPSRGDLPGTPVHISCRCRVLPLTETELLLRQEGGPQRRSVIELVEAKSKEEAIAIAKAGKNVTGARAYAKQVKVNGRKYWRVAKDIEQPGHPLTMGEFLAQATPQTKAAVLGSKKQADRFSKMVSDRGKSTTPMTPDEALRRVTDFREQDRPSPERSRSALEAPMVKRIPKVSRPR
jgi:SPP1 gp7 family putative phage head morphogenesis protein